MKKLKKFVWQSLNKMQVGGLVQLHLASALTDLGWFRSYHTKQSVDKNGKPIPWCTYPFILFIESRLHNKLDIFEFGCGNSTLWYASRVKTVKAVEHDKNWVKLMESRLPGNAKVVFQELEETNKYSKEVTIDDKKYHIVIVDGRKRNRSAQEAVNSLTPDGIIVWDNSNLSHYQSGVNALKELGFKKIDFWGLSPITAHLNCTSIFYRTENCLNI